MNGAASGTYREAHPLPYVLLHWTHLLSMLTLGFTGLFIHSPFLPLRMGVVRTVHMAAAYVLLVALVCRWGYAIFGRSALTKGAREMSRDCRNFLPQPENRGAAIQTLRYYLFLRPTHSPGGKYNPLQKSAYVGIGVLLIVQAWTGFALYGPARGGALASVLAASAGLAGGLTGLRVWHYLLTWLFAAITIVHVYLSLTEDIASVPLMFLWRETLPTTEPPEEMRHAG